MARDTVGSVLCFSCGEHTADLRRNKKGKLYIFCPESCGLVQATGKGAQARLERALAGSAETTPCHDKAAPLIVAPAPSTAAVSKPAPAKPPAKPTPKPIHKPAAPAPDKKPGTLDDWF